MMFLLFLILLTLVNDKDIFKGSWWGALGGGEGFQGSVWGFGGGGGVFGFCGCLFCLGFFVVFFKGTHLSMTEKCIKLQMGPGINCKSQCLPT